MGRTLDKHSGLLTGVDYFPSPNCDERPANTIIDLIVVHGISLPPGQFGGRYIQQFFCNQLDHSEHLYFQEIDGLRVSSHCLIDRQGIISQFVPFDKRAWHAGQSSFRGRQACNDFSIGIELEGTDDTAYTEQQYHQLADLITLLRQSYPQIAADHVVGHADIAPGRKTDPGHSFDWGLLTTLFNRVPVGH